MKILYAATTTPGSSSRQRALALERLGHTIERFDPAVYHPSNPLLHRLSFRLAAGPWVDRLNRDLLARVAEFKPDVVWSDKVLWLHPKTLIQIRAMGIATVSLLHDNCFGDRHDPGWRLYRKTIPHFDLHITPRHRNLAEYKQAGARDALFIQFAYERSDHFPPPPGWSDADRTREVSFIGTPYDDRAATLERLCEEGLPVSISGPRTAWAKQLSRELLDKVFVGDLLYGDDYREGIWRSKINLSFVTHSNLDEFAHKSFEIAGCGGFLLAERSEGHTRSFVEDEEAVFFTGFDELKAKILRYLPDEAARVRIAAAGHARAERDGYHNDRQMALIMERIDQKLRERSAEVETVS